MPIRMIDQGRSCTLTGVGEATLYVQELGVARSLKLAAALVREYEESDRPAAFLTLMISLASMEPYWIFAEAGKLLQSARDDAVRILIAESAQLDAFLAQPKDCSLEDRLYIVYKEQLEAVTVTDELLLAARKVRDQKPFKDPFAVVMAQGANARAIATLSDVQARLAGPLAAVANFQMKTMPAITECLRLHAMTGPLDQALAGLNKSLAVDTAALAKGSSLQLVDLAPKITDPFRGMARFQLDQERLPFFDAYSVISAGVESPFEKAWQAEQERMSRLNALINQGAIASSLYEQSERLSKQAQLMQSGLQGLYPSHTLESGLSSAALQAAAARGSHLDLLSAQAMSASRLAQMAAGPIAALLLVSQPVDYVPRENRAQLQFQPRRRDQTHARSTPVDSDGGRYDLLYELLADDSPEAIAKLDLVLVLLAGHLFWL